MIDVNAISRTILSGGMILAGIVFVGIILIFMIRAYLSWKRYNHTCIIFEKDGFGMPNYYTDKAGIYVDNRTGNKRLFLKSSNVGLNPDKIPYVKNDKNKKVIFLKKIGLKNFQYLHMESLFNDKSEITVGEEDVNWAINAYEAQKKIFGTSLMEKLLPYFGLMLMGVFIIGMLAIVFQKIGVISEASVALQNAANALAQAKGGTTIIP